MEALNKKERNSAILRFSLWLLICVIIISVPVILTSAVSADQLSQREKENENLIKEIEFERDYFAVQIQKIMDLMKSKEGNEIDSDTFNAGLLNVVSDIKTQTEGTPEWRGEMYKNIVTIAEYLIMANKVMSLSSGHKEKQISELNSIILEFEGCGDDIADLSDERNKKDFQQGIRKVDKQFKKAIKMLENYKSGI